MESTTQISSLDATTAIALLSVPLEFLALEHMRQRQFLTILEQATAAETLETGSATEMAAFLRSDVALHILDEEDDLFPLMRRRCPHEDEIETVLSVLSRDHVIARPSTELLAAAFEVASGPAGSTAVQPSLRAVAADCVRRGRRHIALENAVVLPLARVRLGASDLAEMSARMKARRERFASATI